MTDWREFFEAERARVMALLHGVDLDEPIPSLMRRREPTFKLVQPPSRAEIIKAVWAEAEPHWATAAIDGRLEVVYGPVPALLFEQSRIGDVWVIECDGVVVQKTPIVTIDLA